MENRIEYMCIWMVLSMIGVTASMLNYNLKGDSLKHCLKVCNSKAVVVSAQLSGSVRDIQEDVDLEVYCFDPIDADDESRSSWKDLHALMETGAVKLNENQSISSTFCANYESESICETKSETNSIVKLCLYFPNNLKFETCDI